MAAGSTVLYDLRECKRTPQWKPSGKLKGSGINKYHSYWPAFPLDLFACLGGSLSRSSMRAMGLRIGVVGDIK